MAELRARRLELNQVVLAGVRALLSSSDVYDITCDDAAEGFMRGPFPVDTLDLTAISLTRRIPVRELRSKGWRTRAVDHATASNLNPATPPSDRGSTITLTCWWAVFLRS